MTLLIVGGNEKMKQDYITLAKQEGYKPKIYLNMSSKLSKTIGNPEAIIIFTSTVSHKMTSKVQSEAKKLNIPIIRHKSCSKTAFGECLQMVGECNRDCKSCRCIKSDCGRCIVAR